MIRLCDKLDTELIYRIINDAAQAYKGVIPPDRYHEPYMTKEELNHEMKDGVIFWGFEENNDSGSGSLVLYFRFLVHRCFFYRVSQKLIFRKRPGCYA